MNCVLKLSFDRSDEVVRKLLKFLAKCQQDRELSTDKEQQSNKPSFPRSLQVVFLNGKKSAF